MNDILDECYYNAFNLNIRSSLLLPELFGTAEAKPMMTIDIIKSENFDCGNSFEHTYSIKPHKACLHFSEVGTFEIKNGEQIKIYPLTNIEPRLVRLPLLGAAMGIILYQRRNFVLHASAVSINKKAVIFLGHKGDGKSTLAAALSGLGHSLLTDDTTAIDLETNLPQVLSGFPQLKLYSDSLQAALNKDDEGLEKISSYVDKNSLITDTFDRMSRPLKAIYVISEGPKTEIARLSPDEAIVHLIEHCYLARFTNDWLSNGIAESCFHQIVNISETIPIFKLTRARDLSKLLVVAQKVEHHTLGF